MKFKYLGTAASEGFPAVFCNCAYCKEARKRGGKNIRTRAQVMFNDDMLIDLPADTYHHALVNNLELDKVKFLLITHHHQDHFYPEELGMHASWFAKDLREPVLNIVLTKDAYDFYMEKEGNVIAPNIACTLNFIVAEAFKDIVLGDYVITPLPARHMWGRAECFMYMVKHGGKTVLYAQDTGYFFESVFEYFEKNPVKFDFVSYDCTNIDIPAGDEDSHMDFVQINKVRARMKGLGLIDDKTVEYVQHFSHNANPLHEELVENAKQYDLLVAYDGLELEI